MNNFFKLAFLTTTVVLIIPNLPVAAFKPEDFQQLKTSQICNQACDLSNADLSTIYLVEANLENANLQGADLNEVNLNNALLEQTNLSEADLSGAYLRGATLQQADLRAARLNRADFKGVILNQANLQGTRLITANNLTANQIKSSCNWEQAIYEKTEAANQQFISDLRQDLASDPEQPVDCSLWE